MSIPIFAILLALAGGASFVLSSIFYNFFFSDFFLNVGIICFIIGPLIFLAYVVIGLCLEFYSVNQVALSGTAVITPARYAPEGLLYSPELVSLPEGLRRDRRGPLNRSMGRRTDI